MGMIIVLALTLGGVIGLCAIIAGIFGNLASKQNSYSKPRKLTAEQIAEAQRIQKENDKSRQENDAFAYFFLVIFFGFMYLIYKAFTSSSWSMPTMGQMIDFIS